MAPYAVKINAFEKVSMPCTTPSPSTTAPSSQTLQTQPPDSEDDGFMPVTRNKGGKKAKGKMANVTSVLAQQQQFNLMPTSYVSATTTAANTKRPLAPPKPKPKLH